MEKQIITREIKIEIPKSYRKSYRRWDLGSEETDRFLVKSPVV